MLTSNTTRILYNNSYRLYSSTAAVSSAAHGNHDIMMFPSVRRLLTEFNVNYGDVKPSGPQGRVLKGDVLNYVSVKGLKPIDLKQLTQTTSTATTTPSNNNNNNNNNKTATKPTNGNVKPPVYEDIPHNNIRKVIASKLTTSKQTVPHFYMTAQCEIDSLLEIRTTLNAISPVKMSVNDFVIKAVALALRDIPQANAKWDDKTKQIVLNNTVDVSVAVATERGLITPIVGKTDTKSLGTIATELKDLAARARIGKLKPEEFQGGTFSVSNLGMFGITHFNAIINYPQSGILAVGAGRKVFKGVNSVIADIDSYDPSAKSEPTTPKMINVVDVTLSGDNRVFDDEIAAKFLDRFKQYISNPQSMII